MSATEQLMVEVLKMAKEPLSLDEIVDEIQRLSRDALRGRTPKNSLYSIIYRREKRRKNKDMPQLFKTTNRGGATYYSLNSKGMNIIGKRIF